MRLVAVTLLVATLVSFKPPYNKTEAATFNKQEVQKTQPIAAQVEQPQKKEVAVVPVVEAPVKPVAPVAEPTPEPQVPKPQPVYVASDNRAIGQQMAAAKGWSGSQWLCLEKLWTNESNWRTTVPNHGGSGAYGIPQALPAHKMASHGADYLTNPRTQIAWGLDYISKRYSTPCGALSFWNAQYPHWY